MEENKTRNTRSFTEQFDTIFAFLCLEIIALTCFGIGGATGIRILEIIGFFVSLFTFPFIQNNFDRKDLKPNLWWIIPMGITLLLFGFSKFYFSIYGGVNLTSLVYGLLEVLGLAGFFILGFAVKFIPPAKKEYIQYAFFGGLALYCLIVGIYSIARYGLFYAAIYRDMYYYYKGVFFPVFSEGKALVGFEFTEVSLKYACMFSVPLGCSGVGLFGVNPKKQTRHFVILASLAGIGVLYALLTPYLPALIIMLVVYAFAGLYHLVRHLTEGNQKRQQGVRKGFKIAYFIFAGLVFVGIILLVFESKLHVISRVCEAIFHRVPGFLTSIFDAVDDAVYNGAANADLGKINFASLLFGFDPSRTSTGGIQGHPTSIFEINLLWQNGLLALLGFVFLVFVGLKHGRDFLFEANKEELPFRLSMVGALLGIFVYISLFSNELPLSHGADFMPLSRSNIMMAMMFLFGVIAMPKKAEVAQHE